MGVKCVRVSACVVLLVSVFVCVCGNDLAPASREPGVCYQGSFKQGSESRLVWRSLPITERRPNGKQRVKSEDGNISSIS